MVVRPPLAELRALLSSPSVVPLHEREVPELSAEALIGLAAAYRYDELVPILARLGRACALGGLLVESSRILLLLGYALKILGDWDRASSTFGALILHPQGDSIALERACANLAVADILAHRGEYEEAVRTLSSAYVLATDLGDLRVEAYVLSVQSGIHSRTGDQPRARELLSKACDLLGDADDDLARLVRSEIRRTQGLAEFREASYAAAEESFRASAALLSVDDYPVEHAEASRYLGVVLGTQGRHQEALQAHIEALTLFRKVGHLHGQARTFNSIGRTFLQLTRFEEAIFYMEKGVRVCRDMRADAELATIYGKIGNAYMLCEDYGRAIHYLQQDLELSRRFHNYYALAYTHRNLGRCYARGGNLEEGVTYLKDALSLFQFVNDGANVGRVYLDLCQADVERGKLQDARSLGGTALLQLINHKQHGEVAFAHVVLAGVERRLGYLDRAAEHLEQALRGLEGQGMSSRLADAYYEQGLLDVERKRTDAAFSYLGAALSIAKHLGLKKHAARCFSAMEAVGDVELLRHLSTSLNEPRLEELERIRRPSV